MVVVCSCCGQAREEASVVRLQCHEETAVCGDCVQWMSARVKARPTLTPIFPVRDMEEARQFWLRAGVEVELYDAGYAFVLFGGVEIAHLALHADLDSASNAAACYVHVDDAHAWHARWQETGLPVTAVQVQPWGMVEFQVRDPSGNLLRVGRNAE
jgi:catechol 2,3-dioxygenase-like lactoylglutathione lyase family enzyme